MLALLLCFIYWYLHREQPSPVAGPQDPSLTLAMAQIARDVFSPLNAIVPDRTADLASWLQHCDQLRRRGGRDLEKARVGGRLCLALQRANAQRQPLLARYKQHLGINYREMAAGLSSYQKRDYFLETDNQTWAQVVGQLRPPATADLERLAALEGVALPLLQSVQVVPVPPEPPRVETVSAPPRRAPIRRPVVVPPCRPSGCP